MTETRRAMLAQIARMPEAAIVRPRTQRDWSVKDVLAHVAAWEEEAAKRLALLARGRGDRVRFYDETTEIDRFNARVVRAARRTSLRATLRRLARVRKALVQSLRRLPSDTLRDPSHRYPVVVWLPEFAWAHERAHLSEITAWWRRARRAKRS
jgi:uncharacterized damage-inducible protein DinB